MKSRILTDAAPSALSVFSQGLRTGALVQVSGQSGIDLESNAFSPHVGEQTLRALTHARMILEAGGATFEDAVMVRMYLTTRDDFVAMNDAYAEFIAEHVPSGVYPARTTIAVELPFEGMLVEVDVLAVTND